MIRLALAALLFAAPLARAQDAAFTPAQRTEIVKILRQALHDDPSILRDAVTVLQADDEKRDAADARAALVANRATLTHDPADAVAGNPQGDVTLVEFYDPRCPYCRRVLPTMQAIIAKDRNLRVVYKDIPVLGPPSVLESRAIVAAQSQGAYLKMQEALMKNPAQPSEQLIRDTAKSLNLNADKLIADAKSPATTARIQRNLELARQLKVNGTPVFVIGEQIIPGAVDRDQLEAAVAQARKHAAR